MSFRRCNGKIVTDKYIIKYCPDAEDIGDEDYVRCVKYKKKSSIQDCYRCKAFKCGKKRAKNGIDRYNVTAVSDKTCEEIETEYLKVAELIASSDNQFLQDYLDSHRKCIEDRGDFNICQKGSRRKLVISMWENYRRILTDNVDS